MPRYWISHWQFRNWRPDVNDEGIPIVSSGSNSYCKRGVTVGDVVYIVSINDGKLYLGGKMIVRAILNKSQISKLYPSDSRYDAKEWIRDDKSGTPLHLHRKLSSRLSRAIRFDSKSGEKPPHFTSGTQIYSQSTRNIPELTIATAQMFDRIIALTDREPVYDQDIVVTPEMIGWDPNVELLPDEEVGKITLREGTRYQVLVNAVERNAKARKKCIAAHGTNCCICGFNFGEVYGPDAMGFIHVHHLNQVSESEGEYEVDPIVDLRPVCPNCHAVLHLNKRTRTIEEVRDMMSKRKR